MATASAATVCRESAETSAFSMWCRLSSGSSGPNDTSQAHWTCALYLSLVLRSVHLLRDGVGRAYTHLALEYLQRGEPRRSIGGSLDFLTRCLAEELRARTEAGQVSLRDPSAPAIHFPMTPLEMYNKGWK